MTDETITLTGHERELLIRALRIGFPSIPPAVEQLSARLIALRTPNSPDGYKPHGYLCRECRCYHDAPVADDGAQK